MSRQEEGISEKDIEGLRSLDLGSCDPLVEVESYMS
jgi:hypothetical protein